MRPWFRELTRYQWLVLLVAWMGWVFDVADSALFNLAKAPMLTEMLGADYARIGGRVDAALLSVFLVGWAVGGLVFGVVADRYGRTRALVWTILLYCLFTGLTALCRTPIEVGIARFLTALGIGGEWAAGAALVAEVLPDRARAGAASFIQSAAAVGPILAALVNLGLKSSPWPWLFVVGIAPAGIVLWIRRSLHEPPRAIVTRTPLRDLWEDPLWRRRAIIATVIGLVGIAGAGTATYWAPNLVKQVSLGAPKEVFAARISYLTMVSHIGTLAGVFVAPWLCDVIGRRRTILAFFLLAPLALLVGLINPSYGRIMVAMPFVNFFAIGVSATFVLYFPELFPSRIRATGAGLAYNVGRLAYVPIPLITGYLLDAFGGPAHGGVSVAVILTGGLYVVGIAAVAFAPETAGQPLPA